MSIPATAALRFVRAVTVDNRLPDAIRTGMSKVPEVTLWFWVIKIAATTLVETGGDALSMQLKLGYAASTVIFFAIFLTVVFVQVRSHFFHPFLYWGVIVATTTAGTTLADFCDRSLGIGYTGGSLILLGLLLAVIAWWWFSEHSISIRTITSPRVETFYWLTIFTSNTLGTALGDWLADSRGFGFRGAALVFAGALLLLGLAFFFTKLSHTLLFWLGFILTRPLGATLGDILTKSHDHGGMNLSRLTSSLVLLLFVVACILISNQRAGHHPGHGPRRPA